MRTGIIILSGLALWAISVVLARRFGKPGGSAVDDATLAFITFWFLATATNLWVGVAKAGYTLREELPIAAAIFGLPAAVALLVKRRMQ
jgi:hypothetical protein